MSNSAINGAILLSPDTVAGARAPLHVSDIQVGAGLRKVLTVGSIPLLLDPANPGVYVVPGALLAGVAAADVAQSDFGTPASVVNVIFGQNPSPFTGTFNSACLLSDDVDANEIQGSSGNGQARLLGVVARQEVWNGGTFDRWRNNIDETTLALGTRTVTTNSSDRTNFNHKGGHFRVNVTAVPGGGQTLTPIVQGLATSGIYYDILVGTAITTTGLTVLKVYPGINGLAGGAAPDIIPRFWRLRFVHSGAGSWTYSADSTLIV